MAKEYNVVVTKENVSKFLDGVLDFVYANRPLPRYEIHVEGIPTLIVEPKEVTDGN